MCVEPKAKSRNAARLITPGITPKFRRPAGAGCRILVVDVRCGSMQSKKSFCIAKHKFSEPGCGDATNVRGEAPKAMNSPVTSATGLRAYRRAIVACFVFRRERLGLF